MWHGIVDGAKATTDAATRALSEEDLQIFVFDDGVQAFVHPFATKLVLSPKAVVGLTAKSDDAIPFPFLLEESRLSFVVGTMFGCVRTWKPIRFICLECLSQFRFNQAFHTFPRKCHVGTVRVHLAELEITAIEILVDAVVINFQRASLSVLVHGKANGRRKIEFDGLLTRLHFVRVVIDGYEPTKITFVHQLRSLDLGTVLDVTVSFLVGNGQ